MNDVGPSQTALQVAAARAAHLAFDPAPHLLEDRIALDLLGPEHASMLDGYRDDASWMLLENRLSIPLRARYVEDRLAEAFDRGVRQLVLLGAGLDSFAFRQPAAYADLTIFEIDHPGMQDWKRARLEALAWPLPANTRLIPCDFEDVPVQSALAACDFDREAPAFVSWMGVTYYLEKSTIASALRGFADFLAAGSEIVFDVMRPWDELPERYAEIRAALVAYLTNAQEPQVSRFGREEILACLTQSGFGRVQVESPADLEKHYRPQIGSDKPFSQRFRYLHASI